MSLTSEFLKSEFTKRKTKNPNFSVRAFARWLELSPAQVSQVMSGKRPLTLKALEKINKKLDISPFEKQTLENLQKIGKKGFTGQKFVLKKRHFMSLFTNGLVC